MTQPPPVPFGPVNANWSIVHGVEMGTPVVGLDIRKADGICHHVQSVQFWEQVIAALQERIRSLTGGLILPPGMTMPIPSAEPAPPPADLPAELTPQDLEDIRRLNDEA